MSRPLGVVLASLCFLVCIPAVHAQTATAPDTETFEKAKVLDVLISSSTQNAGTGTPTHQQRLKAIILEGPDRDTIVTFMNDYTQLSIGEVFFIRHTTNMLDNTDLWSVSDPYRLNVLGILALVFVALIFLFGGMQGIRGFASLCGSVVLIFYVLIPGILHGYSPILLSIGIASAIIMLGSYITHGFNKTTSSAVAGMIGTVLVTGVGAYVVVHTAHLSGFSTEENVYLNFATRGSIDMAGLLFGGIMIGLLGVLYDIAIGQAIAVEELYRAAPDAPIKQVYMRAIRIGKEHIGALINTLAIAYVGASLPLLLLIQNSTTGPLFMVNNELFATEIVRILIGSIGLILGVPITTVIAAQVLHKKL